jgi:signal transduction histidine kinase
LLSAVLENIPCGVTVFDAEGRLVLDNQSTQVTLHIPHGAPEEVITDFGTLAVDQEAHTDTAHSRTRGSDSEPRPRVREEVQPDGRVLEVRDAPMPTGGLVSTYTDITQHKHIIETLQEAKLAAEQAAAAKAAFLAAMSHEIRTPMNGVIGMINVLIGTGLTSDQREIVEVIRQSGESLLVVINDILDYSKDPVGEDGTGVAASSPAGCNRKQRAPSALQGRGKRGVLCRGRGGGHPRAD